MKEVFINKARTCAVTGHRAVSKSINIDKLKKTFLTLLSGGYDTFLVGMALGFDTICFGVLEDIRKKENIKIYACVPCLSQSYKYNKKQKEEYDRMLSVADEVLLISEEYSKDCMQKRNKFMVDNCSVVVAYLNRNFGGTVNTVKYAEKNSVPVINVEENK